MSKAFLYNYLKKLNKNQGGGRYAKEESKSQKEKKSGKKEKKEMLSLRKSVAD